MNREREESFIATVDSQNRITIPKNVREMLKIKHRSVVRATVSLVQSPREKEY